MSNKSKFKVGDRVVRTEAVEYFRYGTEPVTITWVNEDGELYFKNEKNIPTNSGWLADYFELCVKPENKVPDNMEIVGYQAKVKVAGDWWNINEDCYQVYLEQKDSPFITRIVYAFKQD